MLEDRTLRQVRIEGGFDQRVVGYGGGGPRAP